MTKRVIYPTDTGGVAVIIPVNGFSITEAARKDVPAGVPYKIVDTVDVPSDRTFRNAWEADITLPDGYGIGPQTWFIEQYQAELATLDPESDQDRIAELNQQIAMQQAEAVIVAAQTQQEVAQ